MFFYYETYKLRGTPSPVRVSHKMKPTPDTLGKRLRMARKNAGLTQDQLAAKVGTHQHIISKIERGDILNPRNIVDLAKAVDCSPAWLQFGLSEIDLLSAKAIQIALAYENLSEDKRKVIDAVLASIRDNST